MTMLTNNMVMRYPKHPAILIKLPSNIPDFEGNFGEEPASHVMAFHRWCLLNSIMDNSLRLSIFQRNLGKVVEKWYIDIRRASFYNFDVLVMEFLNHFQYFVHYDTRT